MIVNDVHSKLNETRVARVVRPGSIADLQSIVRDAKRTGKSLAIAGGRHAMGGQQFAQGETLVCMSEMNRVLHLDARRGTVDAEAGIVWRDLIAELHRLQSGEAHVWSIIQKQTGADALTLGGALAANIHGRGLRLKPFIADIESFTLINADGDVIECSRAENYDLFRLVIGGYGLFGIVACVRLKLQPRHKLRRIVRVMDLDEISEGFAEGMNAGFEYGDFQFMTDSAADGFMHQGVLSCYLPVAEDTPLTTDARELSPDDWSELLYLAHTNRARAFELYAAHYLATNNQIYLSDTHQLTTYLDDYHRLIDKRTCAPVKGSEMITEIYVPRPALKSFMQLVREDFRLHAVDFIYGTIRLIEPDDESFLRWATCDYACVIFNLHVNHDARGLAKAQADFRRLINRALEFGGNFYLTYHRWATRQQLEVCYPQFAEFLNLKSRHDARTVFRSEWFRHYAAMFKR